MFFKLLHWKIATNGQYSFSQGLEPYWQLTSKKDQCIFLYGFQKNEKGNITAEELYALQSLALDFLDLSEKQMDSAITTGELIEVFYDNQT